MKLIITVLFMMIFSGVIGLVQLGHLDNNEHSANHYLWLLVSTCLTIIGCSILGVYAFKLG